MGFTQEKKINIGNRNICSGCDEHCKLSVCYEVKTVGYNRFFHVFPTIDGKKIEEYINKYGEFVDGKKVVVNVVKKGALHKEMIDKAREIATLCDKYKTR